MTSAPEQTTSLDEAATCAVARCAEVVCGKWTLLVVRSMLPGPLSFSELEASLPGISPRTLCDRLKLLASEGLISRTRIKALPPRSIYALTERGAALAPIVDAMRVVGTQMLDTPAIGTDADVGCCS